MLGRATLAPFRAERQHRQRMTAQRTADPHVWLAQRAAEGDVRAFENLYRETRDHAYRALFSIVGPSQELPDLVQEVYLQLARSLKRFRGESRFSTFLHGVCANVALQHLRTRRRRPESPSSELRETPSGSEHDPERHVQISQAQRILKRGLDAISPKKRVVFVYHELLGMGPEEIGEALDIPANTVRSRLHHARLEFSAQVSELSHARGEPDDQP
jgi:RNA polymerase sigma-70 factor (ECF subfamily)